MPLRLLPRTFGFETEGLRVLFFRLGACLWNHSLTLQLFKSLPVKDLVRRNLNLRNHPTLLMHFTQDAISSLHSWCLTSWSAHLLLVFEAAMGSKLPAEALFLGGTRTRINRKNSILVARRCACKMKEYYIHYSCSLKRIYPLRQVLSSEIVAYVYRSVSTD